MLALNGIFIAVVALVGGRLAADGEISVGGLVAAVGLAQFLLGRWRCSPGRTAQLAQGRASAARIAAVLAAAAGRRRRDRRRRRQPVRGALRLDGVSHGAAA